MRQISDEELLQLQLDILRDVDAFCRNNQIEYFLVGGTGIGAVRHGGYIPWDDDIDIGMTRPNYNRFIETFNGKISHLRVYAPELNWNYYASYANVCDMRTVLLEGANGHRKDEIGVKIDIFPYDAVPEKRKEFEINRKKARRLSYFCYIKRHLINKDKRINFRTKCYYIGLKVLLFPFTYAFLQKKLHALSQQVPYNESIYLEKIVFPYKKNKPCKKELFESYCDMKFEDIIVRNLKGYDEYLISVFGDYMKLPPEDQRTSHHGFKAYWKD